MLSCQHGGRHQNRDLFGVLDRLKSSAQRHLCFTVTDISANQAIHDLSALHIAFDIADRNHLVICLFIGEEFFKLSLPRCVR